MTTRPRCALCHRATPPIYRLPYIARELGCHHDLLHADCATAHKRRLLRKALRLGVPLVTVVERNRGRAT